MENKERIYVGSGKKAQNYDIVNITICLDEKLKEHVYEYNGKKYINLTVAAKKEIDQYKKSHYVAINTFKPDKTKVESKPSQEINDTNDGGDSLPF